MRIVLASLLLILNCAISSPMLAQAPQANNSNQASFSLSISASQDSAKLNSPVSIEVCKKNISNHAINNSTIRGTLSYQIEVKDDKGNVRTETEEFRQAKKSKTADPSGSFSVSFASLKPGESASDKLDVNKYYDFSRLGKYTIQVSETDPESRIVVKSNIVTIQVTNYII